MKFYRFKNTQQLISFSFTDIEFFTDRRKTELATLNQILNQ